MASNVYFLTFIDDYGQKTWVYLLKQKYGAFSIFKIFKAMVEKESGNHIKILRSHRGGEYMLTDFIEFCQLHGMKRQFATCYTPQQNGIAERKNRTIMNMARSILKEKHLPNEYWGEDVACVVYILNISPTKIMKDRVLKEAWSGKSFHISHLRNFGCVTYAHVPKELRSKLDDRSEKFIFIEYSDESKENRIYNLITEKYIISRDVEFKEEESWDGSIDKSVVERTILSHGDDNEDEKEAQGGQPIPYTPATSTSLRQSPRVGPLQFKTSINHEHGEPSSYGGQQRTRLEVSNDSNPTIATLKNRINSQKTRSLKELYEQNDEIDQVSNFALLAYDPVNFDEVVKEKVWIKAMDEEIDAIERNNTWELVNLPKGKKTIGVKWIYKTKVNAEGEIEKYKERLVVHGFN